MSDAVESSHVDNSGLRPYVKPIKETTDPTITSPATSIDLGVHHTTVPGNPYSRESPSPPFPTGRTETSKTTNAQSTVIGLSVGILVALILTAAVIYYTILKLRRVHKKDEEAAAEAASGYEKEGQGDPDTVSPAPPRYSVEDPVTGVVLPPAYMESRKDYEEPEHDIYTLPLDQYAPEVDKEVPDIKVTRASSVSTVRNMRILV
ncbi:hypothetical protein TWF730_005900 [Orbilia blumenaviensis]|uniref:Uncharacterized protein n=1 Tax=Orbilia blumenaviensis TaxID=1796055 RepID=A0AAV9VLZ8_9PEZI